VLRPEVRHLSGGIHVEQKIDVALRVTAHILGAVIRQMREAHGGEQGGQRLRIGAGEFDELEAIEPQRVVTRIFHRCLHLK
jgi:hypothetical protein